jgi:hypothetical protein
VKKSVAVRLDVSLYVLIAELAQKEMRTVPNFIDQLLRVSLADPSERQALFEKMNPAYTAALPAIRKERDRLASLMQEQPKC